MLSALPMGAKTTLFVLGRANYTTTSAKNSAKNVGHVGTAALGCPCEAKLHSSDDDSYCKLPASRNTNAACQLIAISLLAYEP